jgi:phenylalanyl-tRNA synthetase alpha chain
MLRKIGSFVEEFKPKAAAEIEEFRIRILGKKGELTALMEEFKTVAPELKRELGQQLNRLKNEATERINALREQLQNAAADEASSSGDLTRPGTAEHLGSRHPISLVKNQIVEVFSRLGYTVADGPEIEDDWHVFSAGFTTTRPRSRNALAAAWNAGKLNSGLPVIGPDR